MENKLSDSLNLRLSVLESVFMLDPNVAFNEALQELTLTHPEKNDMSIKRMLSDYKGRVMELLSNYSRQLSNENQNTLEELCIALVKPENVKNNE